MDSPLLTLLEIIQSQTVKCIEKEKKLFFSWFAYKRYGYNVYGKDLSQYCRTINLLKQSLEIETLNYKTTLADATSSIVEQFGCY